MTARTVAAAALLLCAGCFTSSTPMPKTWVVSPADVKPPAAPAPNAFSVTRQGTLTVAAPFDSTSFIVRRADGSVARDSYNVFASPPSTLLRAAVRARLEADGRFGRIVPQSSSASADVQVEVLVRDLSLDCSKAERRTGDAAKGDCSAAFSQAFDAALVDALKDLKEQPPPQPLEPKPKGEQK